MNRTHIMLLMAVLIALAFAAKVQFENFGWRQTISADVAYAAEIADQYRKLYDETPEWPNADQLCTRLNYIDSSACAPGAHGSAVCERKDRYKAGLYGSLELSVHLMKDGTIQYPCH